MDLETGHCCAHWNENTASSQLQLHDTAPGGIHSGTLWLGTRLPHESVDGCLHSLGEAFSISHDQGDQLLSSFAGGTRRSDPDDLGI